jgi:hypothetical protein
MTFRDEDVEINDLGDRWHIVIKLDEEREFECTFPKTATVLDLVNFGDHLKELAIKEEERKLS